MQAAEAHSIVARIAPRDTARLVRTLAPEDPLRQRLELAAARLEALVATIIAELDRVGVDPDLEPSLGASEPQRLLGKEDSALDFIRYLSGPDDEREIDPDAEPSLGSLDNSSQLRWPAGGCDDLELEHDGREPQCEDEGAESGDDEPWLGAPEGSQGYGNGVRDDREIDRVSPTDGGRDVGM